jgi:hypothetical protein
MKIRMQYGGSRPSSSAHIHGEHCNHGQGRACSAFSVSFFFFFFFFFSDDLQLVKPINFDSGPLTVAAQLKEIDYDV